jgi:hypothetical protein
MTSTRTKNLTQEAVVEQCPVEPPRKDGLPGQVVLVMQGGGALGAYQAGVYEALHEAGLEPDWVVGTSIGAINGALIAGNALANRLPRLRQFWEMVAEGSGAARHWNALGLGKLMHNLAAVSKGIPGFFEPNLHAWMNMGTALGVANAAYYDTGPPRVKPLCLASLVAFSPEGDRCTRLTLGAVHVQSGRMRYFDSRDEARNRADARELLGWGCGTVMHVVELRAPGLPGEDHTKDLDFTADGIAARWQAGRDSTRRKIDAAPWNDDFDPVEGIVVHR